MLSYIMKAELLSPAGDMSKLKAALAYGADAVYLGGADFGLRALAGNFSDAELKQAVDLVHCAGKKIYVTLNIFARNNDFAKLIKYAKFLEQIKVDAVIVSDLGVMQAVKQNTGLEIHISTQANVLNKYTAEQYVNLGAKRIILARECSLQEIKEISEHIANCARSNNKLRDNTLFVPEIEVFVHGAMCISYSGRCLLSDYIVGGERSSNRGACVQPCRFKYTLTEEKRPNEHFSIEQDSGGTYIMNSRDLCLIQHLSELSRAGVTSFKIEGRTKSEYYAAGVTNTYRRVLNGEKFDYISELEKISHRPYTTGFVFNEKDKQYTASPAPQATHEFIAVVVRNEQNGGLYDDTPKKPDNYITVEQRNAFSVGDTLEILSPGVNFNKSFTVTQIQNTEGNLLPRAQRVKEILRLKCPYILNEGDILRRKI